MIESSFSSDCVVDELYCIQLFTTKFFMSLRSSADNENQRLLIMVQSLTRHAGAGRHPSDPPRLDTGLRRYDGPRVTIPQVDIPRATIFEGDTKYPKVLDKTLSELRELRDLRSARISLADLIF